MPDEQNLVSRAEIKVTNRCPYVVTSIRNVASWPPPFRPGCESGPWRVDNPRGSNLFLFTSRSYINRSKWVNPQNESRYASDQGESGFAGPDTQVHRRMSYPPLPQPHRRVWTSLCAPFGFNLPH